MDSLTAYHLLLEEEDRSIDDEEQHTTMLAIVGTLLAGILDARARKNARRIRTYLTRPELLPNPRQSKHYSSPRMTGHS
jgi:hypothetical protein